MKISRALKAGLTGVNFLCSVQGAPWSASNGISLFLGLPSFLSKGRKGLKLC